jgi:hypothetical protein
MANMQWALHSPEAVRAADLRAQLEKVMAVYVQTNSDDPIPQTEKMRNEGVPAQRGGTIPKSNPSYQEVLVQMKAGIDAAVALAATIKGPLYASISGHVDVGHRGAGGQPDGIDRRLAVYVDQCITLVPQE